jgi:glucose-1-phosphate cytidylyltransferase
MKVVLFCGGFGLRMRSYAESAPKPMVQIGYRPILWHIMKYYAHFGHKDFVLCLGWKADVVKKYFLEYEEALSNDFVLSGGGSQISLMNSDIRDWNVTFADTGATSSIGERLRRVQRYLEPGEPFLANYTDGLSDLHLPDMLAEFERRRPTAMFLAVRPRHSFHRVSLAEDSTVREISLIGQSDVWMNGGFFIFGPGIFDVLHQGEELVEEPFNRLIARDDLVGYKYEGFWSCMDTYKEKQDLDDMHEQGRAMWQVWDPPPGGDGGGSTSDPSTRPGPASR